MVESLAERAIFLNFAYKITKNRAMEKIILFLIVFGIGSLYEYIKQLKEKRDRADSAASHQNRKPQGGIEGMFRQFFEMAEPESRPAQAAGRPGPKRTADKAPAAPRITATPAPSMAGNHTTAASGQTFIPGELLDMTPRAEEPPMEIAEPEILSAPVDETVSKAAAEHYARWRQAIIDTTIITPKFDQSKV